MLGQPLEAAHDVVAQPADRAAEEARQPGRHGRRQLRQVVVQEAQRLGRRHALGDAKLPSSAGFRISTVGAARAHDGARPHAREAVRGPLVAADHALQQERVRPAPQLRVSRHRRVGVGQDLPVDEGQPPLAGQIEKTGAVRDESHEPDTIAFRASTTRILWARARAPPAAVGYHGALQPARGILFTVHPTAQRNSIRARRR